MLFANNFSFSYYFTFSLFSFQGTEREASFTLEESFDSSALHKLHLIEKPFDFFTEKLALC